MPSGVYKRKACSEETKRKISESKIGKTLKEMNHIESCQCCFCKSKRHENILIEKKKKISLSNKGKHRTTKQKKTYSDSKIKYYKLHKHHLIGRLKTEETKKRMSLTRGGTGIPHENSEYPEEFNDKLKDSIKERDNYKCQNCGMTQEEHYVIYGRDIEVHHIDYDKQNCNKENLITACKQCNIRANFNREKWEQYYNKLRRRNENQIVI